MSNTLKDLTGKRFGKLVIKARSACRGTKTYWHCLCDCGIEKEVWGGALAYGTSRSCGCARNETLRRVFTTHGATVNGESTPEYLMWSASRATAKRNGLPHNLELSDIIIPKFCPVLGIELKVNKGRPKFDSPSLDKLVPSLGYVKGNVSVMSYRANWLKQNSSIEEITKLAEWMKYQFQENA
jgi:hypothetical protein